jgi:hypothetical protein
MNSDNDQLSAAVGIFTGLALALMFWAWAVLVIVAFTPNPDFTDSGVGCVEDCLDPIEEEGN